MVSDNQSASQTTNVANYKMSNSQPPIVIHYFPKKQKPLLVRKATFILEADSQQKTIGMC